MFGIGEIVVCCDSTKTIGLTVNEKYVVIDESQHIDGNKQFIKFLNDHGYKVWYPADRFKPLGAFIGGT